MNRLWIVALTLATATGCTTEQRAGFAQWDVPKPPTYTHCVKVDDQILCQTR